MDSSARFWDSVAKNFDRSEQSNRPILEKILAKIRQNLTPDDLVLDFGCGTGLVCNEIAGAVRAIHAVDISEKMIELARQKAVQRGITNIDYAHTTVFDERFQPAAYDAVLAVYILYLLKNPQETLQRLHQLLKPGGLLLSVVFCMEKPTSRSFIIKLLGSLGLVPKVTFFRLSEMQDMIRSAGFELVETVHLDENTNQYLITARKK
jgi:2-polyprenyl-3-methyl-5-hydroxy-6-metoxy-1,4-benzoquinol methylase